MFRRKRPAVEQSRETAGAAGDERTGAGQEQRILAALSELRDTQVHEIMTPRVDVLGLPIPLCVPDVVRAVRASGHRCFPVYDEDLDNLVGVLFVNDLFRAGWILDESAGGGNEPGGMPGGRDEPSPLEMSRRLRQPYLVPESRLVLDVLADMRHDRRAFAVVVDEYGGVAGVVTVKDLLAALVGDLHDEFDPGGEPDVIRVDGARWLVDGGTSVDDVRSRLGAAIPEGEYVTLGGYLFDAFGHIPEEGERIVREGWEYRVVEMDRRRVAKVVAHRPHSPAVGGGDAVLSPPPGPATAASS